MRWIVCCLLLWVMSCMWVACEPSTGTEPTTEPTVNEVSAEPGTEPVAETSVEPGAEPAPEPAKEPTSGPEPTPEPPTPDAGPEPAPEPATPDAGPDASPDMAMPEGAGAFAVTSSAFANGADIPAKNACVAKNGQDYKKPSLPLSWTGAPAGTKSFVLLMDDLAPIAQKWIHWLVVDIPTSATSLPEGASASEGSTAMPAGAKELPNSWNKIIPNTTGYGAPCPPPPNKHTYRIRIFAMPNVTTSLTVTSSSNGDTIATELQKTALGVAEIQGQYQQ